MSYCNSNKLVNYFCDANIHNSQGCNCLLGISRGNNMCKDYRLSLFLHCSWYYVVLSSFLSQSQLPPLFPILPHDPHIASRRLLPEIKGKHCFCEVTPSHHILYLYKGFQELLEWMSSVKSQKGVNTGFTHSALECIKMRSNTIIFDYVFYKSLNYVPKGRYNIFCKTWALICIS